MSKPKVGTVCVVDDDEDVRNSLRALLESSGFSVQTYSSAAEFLQAADASQAQCLLIDLQMPGMNGLELLEALRARGIRAPAIFVTANGTRLRRNTTGAGALAVLRKPFDDEDLLRWVEKACTGGAY